MLKLGEKIINQLYLGDKKISKAYLGNKLVYQADKPIFLEYIESDGNSYIDTKQPIGDGVTLEIIAQGLGDQGLVYSFDQDWQGANLNDTGSQWFANGTYFAGSSLNKTTIESSWSGVNEDYTNIITINGETATYKRTGRYFNDLLLFAGKNYLVPNALWKGRIYSYKLYKNNVLIQDLRPCLHPKTFEVCMYDTVSKKYLYNQGTGEFIPAPRFVEYIQSTGTQYIDTGVYAPDITRFVVKGTCQPNGESNAQLLGAVNSSTATSFFGSRSVGGKRSWYCVVGDSTSIGNPLNLSIIDATIVDSKNQSGTLTDLVEGTTQSFDSFVGSASSFAFLADNLCIFGGSGVRVSPNATCYDLQLYTADGLVRHFKPCLRGNTPCMYDMVTKKYFYNQGIEEFKYGELLF